MNTYEPDLFRFFLDLNLEKCDPIAATQLAWEGYSEYDCE